ncbi:MAG: peptidyl-prolyl cis-trans isomerase [Prevotella sp.]|jgi:hypothetical protein|nr:peptidyl-prolyl cis-trans isomerase [Prevotella sp.]
MKNITAIVASIAILFLVYSCNENTNEINQALKPIVTVKNETLYKADLDQVMPIGMSPEDSTATAEVFINSWINDKLMYNKAKQNITNRAEIERLVENYRKDLVTNIYQEQLLKQQLSKLVSENELTSYYEQNKDRFALEENIIKGLFLKIPLESSQLSNFKKWYKQETSDAIENIEKTWLQSAVNYDYFYDKWISFGDIMENIPFMITDQKRFLQSNKNIETQDSTFVYLLNIKEYRLEGTEAPYEYIKGYLSEIFTEHRKADYLKQVQKDLYDKAISDDEIKFYNK